MLGRVRVCRLSRLASAWVIFFLASGPAAIGQNVPLNAPQEGAEEIEPVEPDQAELPPPDDQPEVIAQGPIFDNDSSLELPEPEVRVARSDLGDWRGVDQQGEMAELIRAQWVPLSAQGTLTGRIVTLTGGEAVPTEDLDIRFIQEGTVQAQAETDVVGEFTVRLRPGVYSLVASGPNGFMSYSLRVFRRIERGAMQAPMAPDPIRLVQDRGAANWQIDAVAVPPTFNELKRLVSLHYREIELGRLEVGERAERAGADDERAQPQVPPRAIPGTGLSQHRVLLSPDGSLVGRLHAIDFETGNPKLIKRLDVFVIQNDMTVGTAPVNEWGVFQVPGQKPGPSSLVAIGKDGFGAIGFELARADQNDARLPRDRFQLAAWREGRPDLVRFAQLQGVGAGAPLPLALSLIDDPRDVWMAFQPAVPAQPIGAPPAAPLGLPAALGGGFAGGQGEGGGGGGGAGLALAAAALVAIPTAIAASNNGNAPPPILTSPFTINPIQ
jgi:hypothetical protein